MAQRTGFTRALTLVLLFTWAGNALAQLAPVPVFFSSSPTCATACKPGATSCTSPGSPSCCNVLCRGGTLGTPSKAPAGGAAAAPWFVKCVRPCPPHPLCAGCSNACASTCSGVVTELVPATLATVASLGAMSIRTYTAVGGPAVMAMAQTAGLTVTMGLAIPVAQGNAATYTSTSAATALLTSLQPLIQAVMSYPNLVFFFVGNEVEDPPMQGYGPIFAFMDTVCSYIHAVDPYHPCGTATPDISAQTLYGLNTFAPHMDLLASNVYGAALATNPNVGANYASTAVNGMSVNLPAYGAAGAWVLPTYTNAIQGGCCNGADTTCQLSGLFDDSGSPISAAVPNASCVWARPYLISELGPSNWWEVVQTPWGDWVELTSTEKALEYSRNWQVATAMASTAYMNIPAWMNGASATGMAGGAGLMGGLCVGAYAFSVGWVWQATATWINVINEYPYTTNPNFRGNMVGNELIEPIDTFSYLWSGKLPVQRAPTITAPLTINGMSGYMNIAVQVGVPATATIGASDPNGDTLTYTWLILPMPNAPTNHTTLSPITFGVLSAAPGRMTFTTPEAPGYYRLTCYVSDGKGKAATHNIPFEVILTNAPVSAYASDDTYVTDGARLTAGWQPSVTTNYNGGYLALLSGYNPGINQYPYIKFTVPASWPKGQVPGQVTLNVLIQGGAPLTSLATVLAYATPTTWSGSTLTMATAPCSTGYSANAPIKTVATVVLGGSCTLAGTWTNPTLGSWQPVGVSSPPGLQMNGQYISIDVTSYFTSAVMATLVPGVTPVSFMLTHTGSTGRSTFLGSLGTDPTGNNATAPYITFTPNAGASHISATLALSGTTALTAANQASMKAAIAATMPGVSATDVVLTVVGGQVTASISLSAAEAASWSFASQAAFTAGLAADAGVDPSVVTVTSTATSRRRSLRRALFQATGAMEVPITIAGFHSADPVSGLPDPQATAVATALATALTNPHSNVSAALSASGVPPAGLSLAEPPAVWHHLSFGVPLYGSNASTTTPSPSLPPLPPSFMPSVPLPPPTPPSPPNPPPSPPKAPRAGAIVATWLSPPPPTSSPPPNPPPPSPPPPAQGRHLLQAPSRSLDPGTSSALLHNNANSGALSTEMANQGVSPAPDTATSGHFARVSAANRANNPFEGLRGLRHGNSGAPPGPPPAPGTLVVNLQGIGANSASIQLLIIVAVVSIFMAGLAVCVAGAAMLHVMTSSKAGVAPSMGEDDLKAAAAALEAKVMDPPPVAAPRKKVDPASTAARKSGAQEPRRRAKAPQHDESGDFE